LIRRVAVVLTAAAALTAAPSFASTTGVVKPIVRSTLLTAIDTVAGLTNERMIGVTWPKGTATVALRWHTKQGWGSWATAKQDTAASPVGIPGTEPLWRPTGADRVQLRTTGRGLHLVRVADGALHRAFGGTAAHAATGRAVLGEVGSRADWGADESAVRRAPSYASTVVAVTVHHTDNVNGYQRKDVPALIRADYAYHVQSRGWSDLGYNLLIDQYGGIWEGRRGGLGRATVGAHAEGFNTGTLGVSLIGDLTKTTASPAARKALAKVIAYAATTWHFDPTSSVQIRSGGSPRYAAGRVVTLPRVFGHGQTGITDCPGSLQEDLPALARLSLVALKDPPRILSTRVQNAPVHAPTPATVSATLSTAASWTAALYDFSNTLIVASKGNDAHPTLSWDGTSNGLPVLPQTVRWRITATDGFHDPVATSATFEVGLPFVG
jgi:uncharacterized protein with LGFP repeats